MIRSTRRRLATLLAITLVVTLGLAAAWAQGDLRAPLAAPLKVKQGMANVPALSPLYLLPDEARKYNIQIEQVMFQRFADLRTALASGDLDVGPFGPQDISLAASQGVKSLVGVAGVGSGNDCLIIRKGEDVKAWPELLGKRSASAPAPSPGSSSPLR
jgi:ABC-type nitrate/sulfonate/bicarbonate transport system substrate-binding protein